MMAQRLLQLHRPITTTMKRRWVLCEIYLLPWVVIVRTIKKLKVYTVTDGKLWKIIHLLPITFIVIPLRSLMAHFTYLVRFNFIEFLENKIYLGGWGDGAILTTVAKMEEIFLDGNVWTNVGELLTPRSDHRSIVIDNKIVHIGGYPGAQ